MLREATIIRERVEALRVAGLCNATVLKAAYNKQRFAPHSHSTYVVGLVTAGVLKFRCEGQDWIVPAGSICLINPDQVQTGEPGADEGWSYWNAYLPVETFDFVSDERGRESEGPLFTTHVLGDHHAREVLQRFFGAISSTKLPLAQSELSLECLTFLKERFHPTRRDSPPSHEPRIVGRVKEWLSAHYGQPVTLNDAAAIAGVTGVHLTRVFRATTGLALHGWLVQLRVDRAREMLISGAHAADAAVACGFTDQSHMARWLRRLLGMTPKEIQRISNSSNNAVPRLA